MSLSARAASVAVALVLVAAAAGGAYAGAAIARDITEPGTQLVVVADPQEFAEIPEWAERSAGGFTGFGGLPALPGKVLRSGSITESSDGWKTAGCREWPRCRWLVVEAPSALTTIEFISTLRLFRIRPMAAPLAPGDLVLVRLVNGSPTGVLRLLIEQQ